MCWAAWTTPPSGQLRHRRQGRQHSGRRPARRAAPRALRLHLPALPPAAPPGRARQRRVASRLCGRRHRHLAANAPEALLERLGLGERLHHRPNELSGGQQQRVSIARALMNGGQIILADEPTGALDSNSGAEMLRLLEGAEPARTHHHPGDARRCRCRPCAPCHRVEGRQGGSPTTARRPATSATHRAAQRCAARARKAAACAACRCSGAKPSPPRCWPCKGNRLRTALSMLGISIGIASVVSIVALTTAARARPSRRDLSSLISGRHPGLARQSRACRRVPCPSPSGRTRSTRCGPWPGVKSITLNRQIQLTAPPPVARRDAGGHRRRRRPH